MRHVTYDLNDFIYDNIIKAQDRLNAAILECLSEDYKPQSPVTSACQLSQINDFYINNNNAGEKEISANLLQRFENVSLSVNELNLSVTEMNNKIGHPEFFKNAIPVTIQQQIEQLFKRYNDELDLLNVVHDAGIIGVYRERKSAFAQFASYINDEEKEICIIGSSLKGLLQNADFKEIREKLEFKMRSANVRVKFMLTHPSVADLRAKQEQRELTDIGKEIVQTLELLRDWNVPTRDVKLYLGTPTSFAIMTTRKMLINPYSYMGPAYHSPCLILEAGSDHHHYFFDEFKIYHFGAWNTQMSTQINNYDEEIQKHSSRLHEYAEGIKKLF